MLLLTGLCFQNMVVRLMTRLSFLIHYEFAEHLGDVGGDSNGL